MSYRFATLVAGFILALAALAVAPVIGAPKDIAVVSEPTWISPGDRAKTASEDFLRLLRKGNLKAAYQLASPELKQNVAFENFRGNLQIFSKAGMRSVRFGETRSIHKFVTYDTEKGWRWNIYTIEVDAVLTSSGGDTTVHFKWFTDDGTWKLVAFRWDDGSKLIAKPKSS